MEAHPQVPEAKPFIFITDIFVVEMYEKKVADTLAFAWINHHYFPSQK